LQKYTTNSLPGKMIRTFVVEYDYAN
jgi:hypothetical protein